LGSRLLLLLHREACVLLMVAHPHKLQDLKTWQLLLACWQHVLHCPVTYASMPAMYGITLQCSEVLTINTG
jgi:hypothetical protein